MIGTVSLVSKSAGFVLEGQYFQVTDGSGQLISETLLATNSLEL